MQNHLLSVNEPARAAVFVNRCDAKQRVDLYIKCNEWVKAAIEVRLRRASLSPFSTNQIGLLRQQCKDRGDKARIE